MDKLIEKLYKEFKGTNIVRNGQPDDAFEVAVLKVLYGANLDLGFKRSDVAKISEYVIAPPDSGIDIFVENGDGDDSTFDVIQVKNFELKQKDLRDIFPSMKRTIDDFCDDPTKVASTSCREVLSNSNLSKDNKKSCHYYVVHAGKEETFKGIDAATETVITKEHLTELMKCPDLKVSIASLPVAREDGIMCRTVSAGTKAIVCSANCHDLARLCNKYSRSELGRNILFGGNLRESLGPKQSKSYRGMKSVIDKEHDSFWFFNNGITIVAEGAKPVKKGGKVERISIEKFSIVNGAQTTSALGYMLAEAERDGKAAVVDALKKSYVLTRILTVKSEDLQRNIAIFNNTQNPISTRDMVSNSVEQKTLHTRLLDDEPSIFMEIRRGTKPPASFDKAMVHRRTTNELLAQLAYAGFLCEPFTAKDKKSALFTNDFSQTQYLMNAVYHKIFNYDQRDSSKCGVLFRKSKDEIDELLFVLELYKEGKRYLNGVLQKRLKDQRDAFAAAQDLTEQKSWQARIEVTNNSLSTVGICMFYFVAAYFEYVAEASPSAPWKKNRYDFNKFYSDKHYRAELVKKIASSVLMKTVDLLKKTAKAAGKDGNMNNWVRGNACQKDFLDALRDDLGNELSLLEDFDKFMTEYKVVPL